MVVKKDGARQTFVVDKIRSGMQKALEKRPVPAEALDRSVRAVVRAVQERGLAEIDAAEIGDLVMAQLQDLDPVAYVRFASVYREFKDVDEFLAAVRNAIQKERKR